MLRNKRNIMERICFTKLEFTNLATEFRGFKFAVEESNEKKVG